jgi:hypothetical protein
LSSWHTLTISAALAHYAERPEIVWPEMERFLVEAR